jgi:hypothetical protein
LIELNSGPCFVTFGFEQIYDSLSAVFAELLPERFFIIGNFVFSDELEKIVGGKARESTLCEVLILGIVIRRAGAQIREVATPPTRDEDLPPQFVGVIQYQHGTPPTSRGGSAEKTSASSAEDDYVPMGLHRRLIAKFPKDFTKASD